MFAKKSVRELSQGDCRLEVNDSLKPAFASQSKPESGSSLEYVNVVRLDWSCAILPRGGSRERFTLGKRTGLSYVSNFSAKTTCVNSSPGTILPRS